MEAAKKMLEKRDTSKPFYLSMHVMDPHNYLECFSYDVQDERIIAEEMKVLDDYLDSVGTNFIGNILYFMSLRYFDYYLEKFCNDLKEKGLWDNTALLIVADHGSSYSFHPLHGARLNCFNDEC